MKKLLFKAIIFSIAFVSCSKKEPADLYPQESVKINYDTTAIDSFSNGAISVDVARQIRMSSQQYKDSVKESLRLQAEEQRIKEELEKENKKKQEEEKKNTDEENKKTSESLSEEKSKTE